MKRLLVGLVVLLAVAGCGTANSTGDKGYVSGTSVPREFPAAERKPAPAISGTTLQGTKVTLATLAAGRPAVVNVWGSWCPPCRQEAPALDQAAKQLGSQAAFLGVNVRDAGTDPGTAYERRFGITYPSLYDPDGRSLLGMPRGVGTVAIPSTVVIDARGRIASVVLGPIPTARTLVDLVQDAAK